MTSLIIPLPFVLLNLEKVERKRKKFKGLNISGTKELFKLPGFSGNIFIVPSFKEVSTIYHFT